MGVYSKFNRPILVVEYDPQWPVLFEEEKKKLAVALRDRFSWIEHIGSTAVPGLASKPVIDIGLGVRRLTDSGELIPRIERLGYIYDPVLEQLEPQRRFFWKGTPIVHTYHLHLAEVDHPVLLRPIRFRDFLQKHPETARKYGELKKELAKRCGQDLDAYVAGKTAFIEMVMKQAEEEGNRLGAA